MSAPTHMRVRRFVDGKVVDETLALISEMPMDLAAQHGVWTRLCDSLGMDWSIVLDDPESETVIVTLNSELAKQGPGAFAIALGEGMQRLMKARGDA